MNSRTHQLEFYLVGIQIAERSDKMNTKESAEQIFKNLREDWKKYSGSEGEGAVMVAAKLSSKYDEHVEQDQKTIDKMNDFKFFLDEAFKAVHPREVKNYAKKKLLDKYKGEKTNNFYLNLYFNKWVLEKDLFDTYKEHYEDLADFQISMHILKRIPYRQKSIF